MKLTKTVLYLFVISVTSLSLACSDDESQPVASEEEVAIPDDVLRRYIKETLEIDDADPVTEAAMLELTELTVKGSDAVEVTNLTGLEHAENLRYLDFGEASVTDLSPLSNLERVEYLRLNDTEISDLSPLSSYTTLTYFNANAASNITDISPLVGNTGLKEIILREVPVGNQGLQTIANFTELYRINLRSTGVTDISILGDLMAQGALLDSTPGAAEEGGADLDLRDLEIVDWSPIEPYLDQITTIEGYEP